MASSCHVIIILGKNLISSVAVLAFHCRTILKWNRPKPGAGKITGKFSA
jgi:hypothetical protein